MNENITKTEYSEDYIETTFGIIFARESTTHPLKGMGL